MNSSDTTAIRTARRVGVVVAITVVGMVVPVLVARHFGALDHPRSDDWSYLRTLFGVADGHGWNFNGWVSMTLVGQVFMTLPIAHAWARSIVAARIATAIWGAVGLGAVYATARALRIPRAGALLVPVTIAVGPLWGPLASTYMTDVPAFAAQTLAVWATVVSVQRTGRRRWFAAALAFGFLAVSIRQYAIIVLIATLLTHALEARRRHDRAAGRRVIVGAVVFTIATAALFAWWTTIPGNLSFGLKVPTLATIRIAVEASGNFLRLTALLLAPVIVAAGPITIIRRARRADPGLTQFVTIATAALLAISWLSSAPPFVGNYIDRRGTLADDIIHGQRPPVIPPWMFHFLVIGSSIAAIVLVLVGVPALAKLRATGRARLVSEADTTSVFFALSLIGFAGAYALAILVDLPVFDRYVLPVLPIVAVLVLRSALVCAEPEATDSRAGRMWHRAAVATTLALLATVGLVFSAESASYDAARWRVASLAVHAGYPAVDVDGGYEWVGYLLHRAPPYRLLGESVQYRKSSKERYIEGLCVEVVVNPPSRPKAVVAETTSTGLLRPTVHLYAVRLSRPCATAPALNAPSR